MAYSVVDTLPSGEVLVAIDEHFAAVSVEAEWPPNNNGIILKGRGRWCDEKGKTILHGENDVEVASNHNFSSWHAANYPLADLKKEIVLLMLGEPPALMGEERPVLDVSDDVRLHSSIRSAIATVTSINNDTGLALAQT